MASTAHREGDSSPDIQDSEKHSKADPDGVEYVERGAPHDISDPSYVDHRANDDRADEAKGKNSDKYDGKYWLSVNYIGTLFAIGMAFMGGIGGADDWSHVRSLSRLLSI